MSDHDAPRDLISRLHEYWSSLNGGAAPARASFDPAAIKPLLPHLYIVAFEAEPFRVRFRLAGTKADEWNGFSLVGRYVDEFLQNDHTGANRILQDAYQRAWRSGQPVFDTYPWPTRAGEQIGVKFGVFPLTVDGVIAQAISIEDVAPKAIDDEWVVFEDPAVKR